MIKPVLHNIIKPVIGSMTSNSSSRAWTPQIPTGLTATVIDDTHIDLSWTNVDTKGTGTYLQRSTDNITFSALSTNALGVAIYHDTVTVGVIYYYRVCSYKALVSSAWSTVVRGQSTHVVFTDAFTGNTIDTNKWTVTNPDSKISQNNVLTIAAGGSNTTLFRNNLMSVATVANGVTLVQSNVTWTGTFAGEAVAGLYLYKDSQNFIYVGNRSTISPGGKYQVYIYKNNSIVYNLSTEITKGKDIKIWTDGTQVKIYYWQESLFNANHGEWTQIGATQAWVVAGPYYTVLSNQQNSGAGWNNPIIFDNIYLSSNEYISQYPNTTTPLLDVPVWAAQGTVLTGLVSGSLSGACESQVIYEGNPVILTGATNVFKMWYTNGVAGATLCYAESLTGLPGSWQKYSGNPLINPCRCCDLIKIGNVYNFIIANATGNLQAFDLYTSNDGVTLTLDTANVLQVKATAGWDHTFIANKSIIENAGTYYMFYEGNNVGVWQIGLATTSDATLRTWTKYGTVPLSLIPTGGTKSGPQVIKVGSSFYLWGHGQDSGSDRPSDLLRRYKSSDLTTWAKDTKNLVYVRATSDEGVGVSKGQVADICLVEVNSQVYMFYSATADIDQVNPNYLHIKLAIYNGTLAQLVQTEEGRIS
jgi:hypothetical protein